MWSGARRGRRGSIWAWLEDEDVEPNYLGVVVEQIFREIWYVRGKYSDISIL
jgi:hypothetical protein